MAGYVLLTVPRQFLAGIDANPGYYILKLEPQIDCGEIQED
jgi:hypothetical protein